MQFAQPDPIPSELDATPMLGIALQAPVFLLVGLGLLLGVQNGSSRLPSGEVPRPPSTRTAPPITLQATSPSTVVLDTREVPIEGVLPLLESRRDVLRLQGIDIAQVPVVLRVDRGLPAGKVQELIDMGRRLGFEKFLLRTREEPAPVPQKKPESMGKL